jgi:hypothetical protein
VGAAIQANGGGVEVPGGPGPGFHFPNGFAPGASFCNEQAHPNGFEARSVRALTRTYRKAKVKEGW